MGSGDFSPSFEGVRVNWQIAVQILERVGAVIAPLDDPEEIKGVVDVLLAGVKEMAENE